MIGTSGFGAWLGFGLGRFGGGGLAASSAAGDGGGNKRSFMERQITNTDEFQPEPPSQALCQATRFLESM